jgi:hypothetical protein
MQQLAIVGSPALGKAFDELATEVEAGKYKDMAAAMIGLQQKLLGAMPKPGGG